MVPRLEYDPEADALYIYLRDLPWSHMTTDTTISRNIDYAADGEPIGVEFWNVRSGVHLNDVPSREEVTRLLDTSPVQFKVFA